MCEASFLTLGSLGKCLPFPTPRNFSTYFPSYAYIYMCVYFVMWNKREKINKGN